MNDYPSTPSSPSPSPSPILIPTELQNLRYAPSTSSALRTSPLFGQTFGLPRNVGAASMLPSSNEYYTARGALPSVFGMNTPGASGRVPAATWPPSPSPNSMTRQLGFGPRRDLGVGVGGGIGGSVLGMEQMRREYGLGYKAYQSPTQQVGSPISDGSPLSHMDLDTDLLGSPQTGDETLSPAHLTESILNRGDTPDGANRGRRVKRSRSSLRSKNRQKHNEAEMRRRRKLNESFEELAQVCGSAQAQKATVLKTAIFQIQSLEKHIYVSRLRLQALKRLSAEDPLVQKRELLKEELTSEPCVKKEEPATPSMTDLDVKHTQEDPFRPVNLAPSTPSLPEVKKELDLQAQLDLNSILKGEHSGLISMSMAAALNLVGLAWKDIQDLVEYKKRTSQIISNVLQLAQLHINHQSIFSSSIVLEMLCATDGKITDCNNVFCNLFNYSKEQALQLTFYAITHPDSLAATYHIIQSLLSGSTQITQANHKFKTSDGRTISCQVTFWVAATEGRDPFLRMILEPAPVVTPRSSPRSASRKLPGKSSSGTRPVGRRLNSNSAILGATPNSASPLLRVRRQNAAENAALLSTSSNSPTNLNSRLVLESPGLRVRQLGRGNGSPQILLETPSTPSQYESKESSSRETGEDELPATTNIPFLTPGSSVVSPPESQLPPASPSDTTS